MPADLAPDTPVQLPARPRDLAVEVCAEMEAIFAQAARQGAVPGGPPVSARTRRAPPSPILALRRDAPRPSRATGWGTLIAASLFGVSVGAAAVLSMDDSDLLPALRSVFVQPPASASAATVAAAPAVAASGAIPAAAIPAAAPVDGAPLPIPVSADPAPLHTARIHPHPPRAARLCGAGRSCGREAVLAADRQLRRAYDRAVSAGAPRPTLVALRDRWAALRDQASDQPTRLVEGYGGLTRDLRQAAQDAKSHPRRPSPSDGLHLFW